MLSVKYLKENPLVDWFRNKKFSLRNSSIVWNGFNKTLPWLGRCLNWKVGNGLDVRIGSDPVIGVSPCIYFDPDLISYLGDYRITSLQHARHPFVDSPSLWLSTDDLELGGIWKSVWDAYISGLQIGGIVWDRNLTR